MTLLSDWADARVDCNIAVQCRRRIRPLNYSFRKGNKLMRGLIFIIGLAIVGSIMGAGTAVYTDTNPQHVERQMADGPRTAATSPRLPGDPL